jgi:integrase
LVPVIHCGENGGGGVGRRAARRAGPRLLGRARLPPATPHQLRHTWATALINAGCSLQALMAMPGHTSAAMSLRYARLFDATVRADYERALAQAKTRLTVPAPGSRGCDSRGLPGASGPARSIGEGS